MLQNGTVLHPANASYNSCWQTGKPTVVNGEHLDPYNAFGSDGIQLRFLSLAATQVPEELIGEVGLAGPKGEPGKKGRCLLPGLCHCVSIQVWMASQDKVLPLLSLLT